MPEPLRRMRARPSRVRLSATASPESVVARLDPADHPGALWGDWFGGGVVVLARPERVVSDVDAADLFPRFDDLPTVDGSFDGLGGGWLSCLGYSPGHSGAAFYDSLLRWTSDGGWVFESLGLPGREAAERAALARWRLALALDPDPPATTVGTFRPDRPDGSARDRHLAAVEATIGRIHRGDFYQLNLCTRLHARLDGSVTALFARMAGRLQPAYGALVTLGPHDGRSRTVASFSPELFLRVRDQTVVTQPIKGTAPRGPGTDPAALRASTKDAAENIMIVDLMRNDLSRVCRTGTVVVSDLLAVQPHPGVWHLVSTVEGQLDPGVGLAAVLAATFAPGSVTGAPKLAAQHAIAELEQTDRGAYTGSIGFVSPCAGAELSVVIRTFEVDGDDIGLGVGGGVTADSVPVREWYECLHKAQPLVTAAGAELSVGLTGAPALDPGLVAGGVFESILVEHGRLVRLERHLARLDTSCRELWGAGTSPGLADAVRRQVAAAEPAPRMALRVSVRPDPGGELQTTTDLRVLAPRLTSSALRRRPRPAGVWRHKWSDRRVLEAAERAAAPELPYFTATPDSDRLSETSRGNLFLLGPDGVWRTPPLDESLLPGVTRREVLDRLAEREIECRVERCTVADLQGAASAFWTSSLSGVVEISVVDGRPLGSVGALAGLLGETGILGQTGAGR